MVSVIASTKAVRFPDWVKFAYYSTEMSHCLNMVITPLFWFILEPMIFPHLKWHGMDLVIRVHYSMVHALPIISSTINIVLTDIHLQRTHWTYCFVMGIAYMGANGLGTYEEGKPLYPIVDWKNPAETAFLFILMAAVQSGLFYGFAVL